MDEMVIKPFTVTGASVTLYKRGITVKAGELKTFKRVKKNCLNWIKFEVSESKALT